MLIGGSSLDGEMLFYELFTKPTVQRIRRKLEGAQKEQLEQIVQARNSLPWYRKLDRQLFPYAPRNFEINLEYIFARDLLNGSFSWEQADAEKREKEQEREKEIQEAKQREEWLRKGASIQLFMGGLEEYERLKGQSYEIVDLQNPVVYHSNDSKTHLFLGKLGVEALIRFRHTVYFNSREGAGIPIRKKLNGDLQ